jgi:hypothetical protein
VTWAARTERADGKTSPEELAAAAHSACYAMALALRLGEHHAVPARLAVTATVTLDEADGVPTIASSHTRLFAGAKITVSATLGLAAHAAAGSRSPHHSCPGRRQGCGCVKYGGDSGRPDGPGTVTVVWRFLTGPPLWGRAMCPGSRSPP